MSEASALLERLRRHYLPPQPWPGGVFLHEVGWNATASQSRCDAIYVGFTSASGRRLVGHEVKVSRADWRHELDQPGKADDWHDQCHEWWIVAPSTAIVPPEELPAGWGLMVPGRSKTRMDKIVRAEVRRATPSWDAVRSIMARLDTLQKGEIHDAVQQKVEHHQREHRAALEQARSAGCGSRADHDRLAQIEEALGCEVNGHWGESISVEELRLAVAAIREGRDLRRALQHVAQGYAPQAMKHALDQVSREAGLLLAALDARETDVA